MPPGERFPGFGDLTPGFGDRTGCVTAGGVAGCDAGGEAGSAAACAETGPAKAVTHPTAIIPAIRLIRVMLISPEPSGPHPG
jgi:hypothetical protein